MLVLQAPTLSAGYAACLDPDQLPAFRDRDFSLADELGLARLQVLSLISRRAPETSILNALRTLAIIARLHSRTRRLAR